MKTSIKLLSTFSLAALLLAGCGGGGSSSSSGPGPVSGPGALDVGGTGVSTGEVDNGSGTAVPANFTAALDINDLNQVIGFAEVTAGAPFTAAFWTVGVSGEAAVAPAPLNPIGDNTFSAAFAIDESGRAVGQSAKGTQIVAVIWPAGATPVELPALSAAGNSAAYGISADGTLVVGQAQDATGANRAVIWIAGNQGVFAAPVTLPVTVFARGAELSRFSAANGVTQAGGAEILVAGEAVAGDGTTHAALWRSTNGGSSFVAADLGAGHIAYAVNSARQVVGESDSTLAPVSWTVSDQGVAAAPVPLAIAGSAVAINDNGRIAGWSGTSHRATLWNGTVPATLFDSVSQAYGLNNDTQPLVVGRNGATGFVKRVN